MKASFRPWVWIWVLLCCHVSAQTAAATYTVKPGDSLSKIARSQGCTVDALAKTNGIKLSAIIQPGQTLKLPGKDTIPSTAEGTHTIESGDTFSSLSRKYGVSVESLLAANPDVNPKTLKPGQKIRLAASSKPAANEETFSNTAAPIIESGTSKPSAPATSENPEASPAQNPEPPEAQVRTIVVETETTFGEFATQHGTDIQRLNELNGLDLTAATVLAKGSELYVPKQP